MFICGFFGTFSNRFRLEIDILAIYNIFIISKNNFRSKRVALELTRSFPSLNDGN